MKGLFTQGVVVLLERAPSVRELKRALHGKWTVHENLDEEFNWFSGRVSLSGSGPDDRSTAAVAVYDCSWPDHMGDAQDEPMLLAAWTMGHLGPTTWPGALQRATDHAAWWPNARDAVDRHRAFVVLRTSYASGDPSDPVMPPGYNPLREIRGLTTGRRWLLDLPSAICAFNPNGEVLVDASTFDRFVSEAKSLRVDPLRLWLNVRVWSKGEWYAADTVGLAQFDSIDHEACAPIDAIDPNDVVMMLYNMALYATSEPAVIRSGDTTDGPGGVWQTLTSRDGVAAPPRPTYRWLPLFEASAPGSLVPDGEVEVPTQPWIPSPPT